MILGLFIISVYTMSSLLSLISSENLSALLIFGFPFVAEALIILAKMIPENALENQKYVVKSEEVIENDLTEGLLKREESAPKT